MIFKIMTTIVFIAEIIVAYTILKKLLAFDKLVIRTNEALMGIKPEISYIGCLIKKISAQYVEFAYDFAEKIHVKSDEAIVTQLGKLVIAITLLRFNSKLIRKILISKPFKMLRKGLSLLKYVV